ncbi:hypothetical protein KTD19_07665 [Burkholderia multivorans]|uniref:hypothetical protein n=1 Tax=Burkholderia multivorans TaxID=87883 RepID=UPI0012DF74FD|nr:hypothetical protein [Burkholderia multivorans]MBU9232267.1 hypothetical protein [Burkholderia multivorans]QGR90081.1 hypothetical protein FOC30_03830 [Burkholderia multivorans]HEF4738597.1 hypothetical protein [Burkholderia multivorans]
MTAIHGETPVRSIRAALWRARSRRGGICSMRNAVRDRVYSRSVVRRDKCDGRELNCRQRGTIAIRIVGSGIRRAPTIAPSRVRAGLARMSCDSSDDV